ncbi:MAG: site-2 protease family protein, partial [Patescibacteria group bacterium]
MTIILSIIILIISIIAHEVAHGYAADSLGDPTARLAGRLTLNPIPHIDLMGSVIIPALLVFPGSSILFGWAKPVPYNP